MPPSSGKGGSRKLPSGRWEHVIRQSWLNTFLDCPEKARLDEWAPRVETDAAYTGTCVHQAIETTIDYYLDSGLWLTAEDVASIFVNEFETKVPHDQIRWVNRKVNGARAYGIKAVTAWREHVVPLLQPIATEVAFGPLLWHSDEQRDIYLTGSIDYLDVIGPWDWKTAGRKYEKWEKERWAMQPTVYCTALAELAADGDLDERVDFETFTYCVLPDARVIEPQLIPIRRDGEWSAWFRHQLLSICSMVEAELAVWPLNDQHALCGKFCEHFAECKGKFVTSPKWANEALVALSARGY